MIALDKAQVDAMFAHQGDTAKTFIVACSPAHRITAIHCNRQLVFAPRVPTHAECDKGKQKDLPVKALKAAIATGFRRLPTTYGGLVTCFRHARFTIPLALATQRKCSTGGWPWPERRSRRLPAAV
jgi:hypothetical protein